MHIQTRLRTSDIRNGLKARGRNAIRNRRTKTHRVRDVKMQLEGALSQKNRKGGGMIDHPNELA